MKQDAVPYANAHVLDRPVQYLKGVGPGRARLLQRMGIATLHDLLSYYPREYDDRRTVTRIAQVLPGQRVTVSGKVIAAQTVSLSQNLSVFKVAFDDGSGIGFGLFYRRVNPYHRHDVFGTLKDTFSSGKAVLLNGIAEFNFGERQIKVEEFESGEQEDQKELLHFRRIVPVYPLTEGVSQKWLRQVMKQAVDSYADEWPDILDDSLRSHLKLSPSAASLREIHFPPDFPTAERARRRLAFDEFLLLETALSMARRSVKQHRKPYRYTLHKNLLTPFREKLHFEFTSAQKHVINEIFVDMQEARPMNRLLMGDVGSGKTVVSLSAVLLAIENGYQTVLVAPTEILAEQHYLTISRFFDGLPVRIALLSGKTSARRKEKKALLASIAEGTVDLVVGTHAVLEESVRFKNLSLAIIDEQHRFGVIQRGTVQSKSKTPDVLLMTATPIPRTLALTLYGDMDVSTIDQLPPGRQPVETCSMSDTLAYDLAKREIRKGRQAYIVYPLVEESDKVELKAAVTEAEVLSRTVFTGFRIGLLHGQMPSREKEAIMQGFRAGEFDILIATTVIEVGIDVPNATVMIVEHADRFGLATLHQLRGRIGRGREKSFCVLLGNPKTEEARKRMQIMVATQNGFTIAEEDLALRGPGEFFGTQQHGMPALRAGNLITDSALIEEAKDTARGIIDQDPHLGQPSHAALRAQLLRTYQGRLRLFNIG